MGWAGRGALWSRWDGRILVRVPAYRSVVGSPPACHCWNLYWESYDRHWCRRDVLFTVVDYPRRRTVSHSSPRSSKSDWGRVDRPCDCRWWWWELSGQPLPGIMETDCDWEWRSRERILVSLCSRGPPLHPRRLAEGRVLQYHPLPGCMGWCCWWWWVLRRGGHNLPWPGRRRVV